MAKDLNGKKLPTGITQRKDGRYMARFEYRGEKYTLYDFDLAKLKKELRDTRYEVEHGISSKESKITVDFWFNTWIKEYKLNSVKYGTIEAYKGAYRCYIKKTLGKRRLAGIRPDNIQTIFNEMSDKQAHKTIKLVKTVLGGMCKQAMKNGIIQRDPVPLTNMPRNTKKKEFRVLTLKEQELFKEWSKDNIYYDVYQLALGTGMRVGELRALEWSDIDFKEKVIHVTGTLKWIKGKGYYKDLPKTTSSKRDIPMLDSVYTILKKRKKERAEQRIAAGNKWQPTVKLGDMVFCNEFGEVISHDALNREIRSIESSMREAGYEFEHITPHILRHTFATRGLEAGIPPKVMQELLGHTSITMTLDIYSHVLPDTKASEIQKIANLI